MDNDCYSVIVSEKAKKMLVSHAAFLAKVSPDAAERLVDSDLIETRVIGGVKYIMICADENVEVNGVSINIKE